MYLDTKRSAPCCGPVKASLISLRRPAMPGYRQSLAAPREPCGASLGDLEIDESPFLLGGGEPWETCLTCVSREAHTPGSTSCSELPENVPTRPPPYLARLLQRFDRRQGRVESCAYYNNLYPHPTELSAAVPSLALVHHSPPPIMFSSPT